MADRKLFDSELKVMNVLWKEGDLPARQIAQMLKDQVGWNVNTTYTLSLIHISTRNLGRTLPS